MLKCGCLNMKRDVADLIKQRRLQIIAHSYIYYAMSDNIISDDTWSRWAKELVQLQKDYPDIAKEVVYNDEFKDFDGSTGFQFIGIAWAKQKAEYLVRLRDNSNKKAKKKSTKKKLF